MSSSSSFISSLAFALIALTQLSISSPVPTTQWTEPPPTPITSTGATGLPAAPPAGQSFKYVAIGRGVQNYTCASTSAKPVAIGAKATLFDGTQIASEDEKYFNTLPAISVYHPVDAQPPPISYLPILGHHFFGADGTPTFDLTGKGTILYGKKNADIVAPSDANKGPAGTGAVDWLELIAKPDYPSVGLKTVYRVDTAGGNPPTTCTTTGLISVQYAAEYWFYD